MVNVKYGKIISTRKENYLEVKKCLGPVFSQVDDLQQNGIEVDGIHYTVTW